MKYIFKGINDNDNFYSVISSVTEIIMFKL